MTDILTKTQEYLRGDADYDTHDLLRAWVRHYNREAEKPPGPTKCPRCQGYTDKVCANPDCGNR
jgi:hypothetical protein